MIQKAEKVEKMVKARIKAKLNHATSSRKQRKDATKVNIAKDTAGH